MSKFKDWAQDQFTKLLSQINPCNDNDEIDPTKLNDVISKFANVFAWLITIAEIECNNLNIAQASYESWKKKRYGECERKIKSELGEGGRYTVKAVESRMSHDFGEEEDKIIDNLNEQISRANLLKMYVKVLDRQANMLQTLCSNLRSELFFAGGIPISRNKTESEKTIQAKTILKTALRAHNNSGNDVDF